MVESINLKGVGLSKEKTNEVETEIIRRIQESPIRQFFKLEKYTPIERNEVIFSKIGINSITNKEWFVVDAETGTTYWDYKELPWIYAVSIEEAEERMVIQTITNSILDKNRLNLVKDEIDDKKRLNKEKLGEFGTALEEALDRIQDADLIITNIYDSYKFYYLGEKFIPPRATLRRGADIMGEYVSRNGKKIPIYLGRLIPKWDTLVTNTKIGKFLIKEKDGKELIVRISPIEDKEREEIKKNLSLTDNELDNRARVYIEEIVTFNIVCPEKAILVQNKNHKEE